MNYGLFFAYAAAGLAGILAVGAASKAGKSPAKWTFAIGMALAALDRWLYAQSFQFFTPQNIIRWQETRLVFLSLWPAAWLAFSLVYSRGNARESLRRWLPALALIGGAPVVIAFAFRSQLAVGVLGDEPAHIWLVRLGWPALAVQALVLVGLVLVMMNLERTYRAAVGTMRWRIKFMLLGLGIFFAAQIYTGSQSLIYRGIGNQPEDMASVALVIGAALMARSLLRSIDFDLDIYPSKAVLEKSVTLVLAGGYLLAVGILAKVVELLQLQGAFALQAFVVLAAVILLAVLLQSDRVRLVVRRFVARNFERPDFDYRSIWLQFTGATAAETEQASLARSLASAVATVFDSLSVTIWLLDERRETFEMAATTSRMETREPHGISGRQGATEVAAWCEAHAEPFDFEDDPGECAAALRIWHPVEFPEVKGRRVCVPLRGRGELIGLLLVGDRVGGGRWSEQDHDIFRCVGAHVAASLLNLQLSGRVRAAAEMDAFQTMATFFVHDLKNSASTLNLMLQNLPHHFDDPAFREDALRGIGKTVDHINHLIGRLGSLRRGMKIEAVETDLNDLIRGVISGLDSRAAALISTRFGALPTIAIDREQITKVVLNLLINALEAVEPQGGRIEVATSTAGETIQLTVSDNGCGMSPEFMRERLFKAFQSSKKQGLGIGMFQSRVIVEAHRGRITASSQLGQGTKFMVVLPLRPA